VSPARRRRLSLLVALVAVTALGLLATRWARGWITVDQARAVVEAWGPLGPIAFIACFVAGFFLPGPELLFVALGGVLFGRWLGFVYALVAVVLGTTLTFALVRFMAQAAVQRALHAGFPQLAALDGRLARHGVVTVALLRCVLFLAPPLNWALGASSVSMRDYVVGTALGCLPGLVVTVWLADRLTTVETTADLWTRDVAIPLALLVGFFVVAGVVGRRLIARSRDGAARHRRGQP
jgi:phospholipase D1/2